MNKVAVVIGVAAVATLAGCKDPDYVGRKDRSPNNDVKLIEPSAGPQDIAPERGCKCPPGTKHYEPCRCGAADCLCVVVPKPGSEIKPVVVPEPAPVTPAAKPAAAPEFTTYIVQRGDTLSKVSKKFNIRIDAIKKLNNMTGDSLALGRRIKLPGKVEVGEQTVPAGAVPVKSAAAAKDFTGATKEYVVKSGDSLGAIAYGNGITIRQLKSLNGLTTDSLKIGQKLKIPAEKVVRAKTSAAAVKPAVKKPVAKAPAVTEKKAETPAAPAVTEPKADTPAVTEKKVETPAAPAVTVPKTEEPAPVAQPEAPKADAATTTYTVQDGDDMTSVSIAFGVSAAAIRELNNLGDADQLKPGQVIKLPADAQQ